MKILRASIAAVAFSAIPFAAQAVIVDSFETAQGPLSVAAPGSDSDAVSGAGILGTEREIMIQNIDTNPPVGNGGLTTVTADDSLAISDADTVASVVNLLYDGVGNSGLGGFDFTADGSTLFSIGINSLDLTLELTIEAASASGSSALTKQISGFIPSGDPVVRFDFPFTEFAAVSGTGADFTSIDSINFKFDDVFEAYDLNVEFIESRVTGVPLPAGMLLMLSGLIGLGFAASRRFS